MARSLSSAAWAAGLSGSYRARISSTTLNGALNGVWTLKFTAGHYAVAFNGRPVIKGKDSIQGSTITVGSPGAHAYCHAAGRYTYHRSGSSLTFTEISDGSKGCGGRRLVLTKGHFTKVS